MKWAQKHFGHTEEEEGRKEREGGKETFAEDGR